MLCIIIHDNVEHNLAIAYGDEFNPDEVKAYEFADAIGLLPPQEKIENIGISYRNIIQALIHNYSSNKIALKI